MRIAMIALAMLGLAACDRAADDASEVPVKPAALTFDGADYKDPAAKVAHGQRLAVVLSCTGCHGDNLQGKNVSADDPDYGDMNAPNLTLAMANYSDADFVRLMRQGVPKDGREFWFMPVESYQFLSDADLAAMIAYLRTFKPAGTQLPPIRKGKEFAEDIERGFDNSVAQTAEYRAKPPVDLGPAHAKGRYIAMTSCTACHNGELQGYDGFTPSLDIAGSYSAEELTRLLTTGEGKVKKNLGLMTSVGKDHFSKYTPRERAALVAYIKARVDRPQ
ncbi:MAG: cytochrome c [Pseudomonadota bacterium]